MSDANLIGQGLGPDSVKTVLIVEDDTDIGEALTAFLKEATMYQVIHVSDGFAALKMVRTLTPHLILLDYLLPNMDDLECLDQLRATKGVERTPVILMSATLPKSARAHADLVLLEKPFDLEALLVLISQLIES